MGKIKNALAAAAVAGIDEAINSVPDLALRTQLRAVSFAVKVPYAFLKELLPTETDKFVKEVLSSDKLTKKVIQSAEFQQALGNTLQNMVYAKEEERREIVKKAFTGAYISQDDYAKDNLERLQETANRISIPALQHLSFVKREILPIRSRNLEREVKENSLPVGFTVGEYMLFKQLTTPISKFYDEWHQEQQREAKEAFNKSPTDTNRQNYDLSGAKEQKLRRKFSEYWSELSSLGIFRQGNDPTIGLVGGGGGTVQYLTEFGEEFIKYLHAG